MQATCDAGQQSPTSAGGGPASGILEGADGVSRLFHLGKLIGKCYGVRSSHLDGTYVLGEGAYQIEWRRWSIERFVWSHSAALFFLQGGTIANIFQPFLPTDMSLRPITDPEPGLDRLVLAEIFAVSSDLTTQEVFQLLASEARWT